ncbi:hypothetical protein [Alkalihalobacterium alkalinitrilicum]|uniref:hypothetical protein n=1 Tax=Alkalihalobacterium alkalinitrilicum TaxID=427920 RepID=UPI001EE40E00|nr:hypothetical protein [Alkalihalobacterium alkalinitrilicum]
MPDVDAVCRTLSELTLTVPVAITVFELLLLLLFEDEPLLFWLFELELIVTKSLCT